MNDFVSSRERVGGVALRVEDRFFMSQVRNKARQDAIKRLGVKPQTATSLDMNKVHEEMVHVLAELVTKLTKTEGV